MHDIGQLDPGSLVETMLRGYQNLEPHQVPFVEAILKAERSSSNDLNYQITLMLRPKG